MDHTAQFYSGPTYVGKGAGFPVFSGSRRQRGGSALGAMKSIAMPILSSVGKTALKQAVGLAGDVVGDVIRGRNIKDSMKEHGIKRLKNVGKAGLREVASTFNPFSSSKRMKRKRTMPKRPIKKRKRIPLF